VTWITELALEIARAIEPTGHSHNRDWTRTEDPTIPRRAVAKFASRFTRRFRINKRISTNSRAAHGR
jgi:hypothetical protein